MLSRSFFWVCLLLSLWAFSSIFGYGRFSGEMIRFWTKVSYTAQIGFVLLILRFFLIFTGKYPQGRKKFLIIGTISLLPALIIYMNLFHNAIVNGFPTGFWFMLLEFTVFFYNLASLALVFFWYRRTRSPREKKQALLFIISALLAVISAWIVDLIAARYGKSALSPITTLIWFIALVYIILRYRFIQLTPHLVSPDILDAVNELVMLVDSNRKVITLNRKGRALLNGSPDLFSDLKGEIDGFGRMDEFIDAAFEGTGREEFFRIFLSQRESICPLDIKMKTVLDRFKEPLGVLIVGSEVPGIEHFQKRFGLTSRQAEVIVLLLSGLTNKEIADRMFLSERTVKGHLTNIYNKLGINNKIELYNLSGGFNMIGIPPTFP